MARAARNAVVVAGAPAAVGRARARPGRRTASRRTTGPTAARAPAGGHACRRPRPSPRGGDPPAAGVAALDLDGPAGGPGPDGAVQHREPPQEDAGRRVERRCRRRRRLAEGSGGRAGASAALARAMARRRGSSGGAGAYGSGAGAGGGRATHRDARCGRPRGPGTADVGSPPRAPIAVAGARRAADPTDRAPRPAGPQRRGSRPRADRKPCSPAVAPTWASSPTACSAVVTRSPPAGPRRLDVLRRGVARGGDLPLHAGGASTATTPMPPPGPPAARGARAGLGPRARRRAPLARPGGACSRPCRRAWSPPRRPDRSPPRRPDRSPPCRPGARPPRALRTRAQVALRRPLRGAAGRRPGAARGGLRLARGRLARGRLAGAAGRRRRVRPGRRAGRRRGGVVERPLRRRARALRAAPRRPRRGERGEHLVLPGAASVLRGHGPILPHRGRDRGPACASLV